MPWVRCSGGAPSIKPVITQTYINSPYCSSATSGYKLIFNISNANISSNYSPRKMFSFQTDSPVDVVIANNIVGSGVRYELQTSGGSVISSGNTATTVRVNSGEYTFWFYCTNSSSVSTGANTVTIE